jgi:hypothetical protein
MARHSEFQFRDGDLEALRDLTASRGWELIESWQTRKLDPLLDSVLGPMAHDQTQYLRGQINEIKAILGLPRKMELAILKPAAA